MEREEILEKSSQTKNPVGEMEKTRISKSAVISLIVVAIFAIAFIIIEGLFGHLSSVYAIATLCYLWASVFYTLQYFLAKRPWPVLIGAVLEGLAGIYFMVRFILYVVA